MPSTLSCRLAVAAADRMRHLMAGIDACRDDPANAAGYAATLCDDASSSVLVARVLIDLSRSPRVVRRDACRFNFASDDGRRDAYLLAATVEPDLSRRRGLSYALSSLYRQEMRESRMVGTPAVSGNGRPLP